MLKQCQQQPLPKLLWQRELAAQLPCSPGRGEKWVLHAWGGRGRRLSGHSAARRGGQPEEGQSHGHKEAGSLYTGVGLGLGGYLLGSIPAPPVSGIQPWSGSGGPG